jgi:hypothetical protein
MFNDPFYYYLANSGKRMYLWAILVIVLFFTYNRQIKKKYKLKTPITVSSL